MNIIEYMGKSVEITARSGFVIRGKIDAISGCFFYIEDFSIDANNVKKIHDVKNNSTVHFDDCRFDHNGERVNLCKKCQNDLHLIYGLHLDSEGLRSSYYCDNCSIIFVTYREGISEYKVLKHKYTPEPDLKNDLIRCCRHVLNTLEGK